MKATDPRQDNKTDPLYISIRPKHGNVTLLFYQVYLRLVIIPSEILLFKLVTVDVSGPCLTSIIYAVKLNIVTGIKKRCDV